MVKDKRITVRLERCMGCHSCEFACAVAHSRTGEAESTIIEGEKPGYRINVEEYSDRAIPIACNHCEEAACLLACPTGAIHRPGESGPVLLDRERCIGCRMCVQACPFGVMAVSPEGTGVLKCDLCIDRLAKHLEPACVNACPTGAIAFETPGNTNRAKRKRTAELIARSAGTEEG